MGESMKKVTHEQLLKDVPSQEGFPWTIVWPTQPE
jgi:hypothetical protein